MKKLLILLSLLLSNAVITAALSKTGQPARGAATTAAATTAAAAAKDDDVPPPPPLEDLLMQYLQGGNVRGAKELIKKGIILSNEQRKEIALEGYLHVYTMILRQLNLLPEVSAEDIDMHNTTLRLELAKKNLDRDAIIVDLSLGAEGFKELKKIVSKEKSKEKIIKILELFYQLGYDADDSDGREEPLIGSVYESNINSDDKYDVIKWLLEHGADPNAKDSYKTPALFYFASEVPVHAKTIKLLLDFGDPLIKDEQGRTLKEYLLNEIRISLVSQKTELSKNLKFIEEWEQEDKKKKAERKKLMHEALGGTEREPAKVSKDPRSIIESYMD